MRDGGEEGRSTLAGGAITGLSWGMVLNTDADVSFMLQYDGNIRIITKSLSIDKFGWPVKNPKILPLIRENGGFQKTDGR